MGRTIRARPRYREGRGIGERLAEIVVYVVVVAALIAGARWYFVVYRNSPSPLLSRYIGAVNAGNVEEQFRLLSEETRQRFGSLSRYENQWKPARNLTGRISNFVILSMKEDGPKAEATVRLKIRDAGQELYIATTKTYTDQYVLRKEGDGWRVALHESWDRLESRKPAEATR
jgi:hypothetical protein